MAQFTARNSFGKRKRISSSQTIVVYPLRKRPAASSQSSDRRSSISPMECDTSTVIHVECPLNAHNSLLSLGTLWSVQIRLKPPRLWKSPRSRRARLISMFQASTPSTAKRAESIPRPSSSHLSLSSALNPTVQDQLRDYLPSNLSSSTKSKQWPLWLEHANSSGRRSAPRLAQAPSRKTRVYLSQQTSKIHRLQCYSIFALTLLSPMAETALTYSVSVSTVSSSAARSISQD